MSSGSKPGERRGGRQKGKPNTATATLKERARLYSEQALQALVEVCLKSESDAARVSAANSLLDRGYGKASQAIEHSGSVELKPDLSGLTAQQLGVLATIPLKGE